MRYFLKLTAMTLACLGWFSLNAPVQAYSKQYWEVVSPNHGQTYAYGSLLRKAWMAQDKDQHLALLLTYTNDPFVDNVAPRRYDYFTFNFPKIKLGADGKTFYYRASNGRLLPVAEQKSGFLGFTEIKLLPTSQLIIEKPHGYLTVTLIVQDMKAARSDGL